jgi:hypothetical protein
MVLRIIYLVCLLLSAVSAVVWHRHLKSRQLTILIPYLCLLSIQEISVGFYVYNCDDCTTGIVYNIYKPISAIFLAFFYYNIPFNAPLRKMIVWMIIVYLLITFFTFAFIHPINIYNNYLSLAGGLVITCCSIFFLFNYFNLDNRTLEKHWQPVVWISIGIVLFYPIVNISFSFYKHLLVLQADIFGIKVYNLIPRVMSIFMYSCFTYAFYLCKKKN